LTDTSVPTPLAKPPWLRRRLPTGPAYERLRKRLTNGGIHTVCQEARCPNQWECFSKHTATFLILGDRCTRNCGFCAVAHGPDAPPDPDEPRRVAETAKAMGLRFVVVTSVTRDDLPDGGASLFAETIRALKAAIDGVRVEVLIPDFQGNRKALATVLDANPDVLNHNIETVPTLYPRVRPQADYRRSLDLLAAAHAMAPAISTKSGLMLGLGETETEVRRTLADLRAADCRLLTLGQYLQPSPAHLPVTRYVPPEHFDCWAAIAREMGFDNVASGPFVRSSYEAHRLVNNTETSC